MNKFQCKFQSKHFFLYILSKKNTSLNWLFGQSKKMILKKLFFSHVFKKMCVWNRNKKKVFCCKIYFVRMPHWRDDIAGKIQTEIIKLRQFCETLATFSIHTHKWHLNDFTIFSNSSVFALPTFQVFLSALFPFL